MFTGLIEDVGKLAGRDMRGQAGQLVVTTALPTAEINVGDSVAVNGACLTAECVGDGTVTFHALQETLRVTNLGRCPVGACLNLERALRVGDRLGGHFVTGHVDAVADILAIDRHQQDIVLTIGLPGNLSAVVIPKGSIAVNGISLTIAAVAASSFTVHIIPHSWEHTNLRSARPGDPVNLEGDMLGKYIIRFEQDRKGSASVESLRNAGFMC